MDLKDIKEIIALMRRNDLSEFELETEDFRVKLRKGSDPIVTHTPLHLPAPAPAPSSPAPAPAPAPSTPAPKSTGREITSPTVGTFYSAPTPEASPFVSVGDEVTEDTVICIIEAMKVMNEIKADTRGVIAEILLENGKPVQFGQPLFRLK